MNIQNLTLLVSGIWLILSSLLVTPNNNVYSKLFFRVVPFFIGLSCLLVALKG